MKCPKCKNEMELNFNLYKCYHCSVPAEQRQKETIPSENDGYIKIGGCFCKTVTLKKKRFFVIRIIDRFINLTRQNGAELCSFLNICCTNKPPKIGMLHTGNANITKTIDTNYLFIYRSNIDILEINIDNVHAHLRGFQIDQLLNMIENFLI